MKGQQNNQTQKEHSWIEMACFGPPDKSTTQVGPFPGRAKRPSTDNQRSDRELDGHQVVRYNPPFQEDAMHDIVVSGLNRTPGATASGQSISQESDPLLHRDIWNVRDAGAESCVLDMRELEGITKGEESTQMVGRDGLDSEVVSEYKTFSDETTTDDESYFPAESELQFHPFSNHPERLYPNIKEPSERLYPNITEPSQEFVYSSKRKPKRGRKQKCRIHGGSKEVDDKYWRNYSTNDDNTSELSLFAVSEPEGADYFPSLSRRHLTQPQPIQSVVHTGILDSDPGTNQHCATTPVESPEVEGEYRRRNYLENDGITTIQHCATAPVESSEVEGEYFRRNYLENDVITSELSCIEQGVPRRQWYRSKNMRLQNFHSPSRHDSEDYSLLLIMSIIFFLCAVLLFAFVVILVSI